jgi:hypothetical protein
MPRDPRLPKFRKAIALMLEGHSDTTIARILSVHKVTFCNWKKLQVFVDLQNEVGAELVKGVTGAAKGAASKGIRVIHDILDDNSIPLVDRESAARFAVNIALEFAKAFEKIKDDNVLLPIKRGSSDE